MFARLMCPLTSKRKKMHSVEMNTITDTLRSRYNQSQPIAPPPTQFAGYLTESSETTIPAVTKHPHNNSVILVEPNFPRRMLKPTEDFEKFSKSLMRNKTLLVPTRLALKRQRTPFKPPAMKLEPIYTDTLQMELGNPEEVTSHIDRESDEGTIIVSEQNQTQGTSNNTNSLRGDTPHTLPTDISLLYREKPLFSHPVTGHFIVQYAEENGGPSPCSYVLPRKSCREKNAPAFTFGARCLVEKKGGSRTAWEKQWFAHSNPYTTKVDFKREIVWPTPFHYPARPTLGTQPTKVSFPAWSIGKRLQTSATIKPENNPSPDTYDTISAFKKLREKNTHITLKSRPEGTKISTRQTTGKMPGPNAYDERKFLSNKYSAPKHSFGRRMPTSYAQDPYVNTLPPSIKT